MRRDFLLLIGDDGGLLFPPSNLKKAEPVFVTTDEAPFFALLARAPRARVRVLCDFRTQKTVLESLPPVSFFDRAKLLERRLTKLFPETSLRASLSGPARSHTFVALEETPELDLWRARLMRAGNPWEGIALLPAELAGLGTRLSDSHGWQLFLLAHRTGGFRQIVTRDGHYVFSRLTPSAPQVTHVENVADSLLRDIQGTRLYLGRLGFGNGASLGVCAVLPSGVKEAFQAALPDAVVLTPYEAAARVGLQAHLTPQESEADKLSLLWAGARARWPSLLTTAEEKRQFKTRDVQEWGTAAAFAVLFLALVQAGVAGADLVAQKKKTDFLEQDVAALRGTFTQLQTTAETTSRSLARLREAVEKRRFFEQERPGLSAAALSLASVLGNEARVTKMAFGDGRLLLDLRLEPMETLLTRSGLIARFDALATRLRAALPGQEVSIVRYAFPNMPEETLTNKKEAQPEPVAYVSIAFPPVAVEP